MRRVEECVIFFHAPQAVYADKPSARWRSCYDWMDSIVCALIAILLLFTFCFRPARVDGNSMLPTLHNNDWLIVADVGYTPQRGDVVIVTPTLTMQKTLNENIVKRIIAVGGDTIDIDYDADVVTVNGEALSESYILETDLRRPSGFPLPLPLTVPEGYVFVMGDNRNDSTDSRSRLVGLIDERFLLGEAKARIFPFGQWRIAGAGQQGGE